MKLSYATVVTLVIVFNSVIAEPAGARTWLVSPIGGGDAPTIQAGIDSATAGDVVELANGVFQRTGNRDLDFGGKSITVRSQNDSPEYCIIDCEGSYEDPHRGFIFHSGEDSNSVLQGITIKNGSTQEPCPGCWGGAILCENESSPTIRNCVFLDNVASSSGGAIKCMEGCSPKIVDCSFIDNIAAAGSTSGGGLSAGAGYRGLIARCTFMGNSAGNGGAAAFWDSSPEIVDCDFIDNHAGHHGGGVQSSYSSASFHGCSFRANSALFGGGLIVIGGESSSVVSSTFVANAAPYGAGIDAWDSVVQIHNTIIAFNTNGEGVFCEGDAEVTVHCSDLHGNEDGDWIGCVGDQAGVNGNLSVDPQFCDSDAGDLSLFATSPCLPENNDCGTLIGAAGLGCSDPTAIPAVDEEQFPGIRSFPNPFNPNTTVSFELDRARHLSIAVLDISGKQVLVLVDRVFAPGSQSVAWNGRDALGRVVPAGTYFIRLQAGEWVKTSKVSLVR